MHRLVCLGFIVLAGACGSDPVNYSAPVGIELKAKSGDVVNGVVDENKAINTESGNPYGAFITAARNKVGHDPSRVEIESLTLILGAQSTGVTGLEEIFTGQVDVLFLMNDTNNTYNVGHVVNPSGETPVPLVIDFDGSVFAGADRDKLLGGSFKVVMRGNAATGFDAKGADATLQLTFTFKAFE